MRACVLLVVAACGEVPAPKVDAGEQSTVDADPAAPPTVVSVTPMNNATGVTPDTLIVVTFSKPMNQSAVEAAWTSADLPNAQVAFSWNAAGDTMMVAPNQPLPVATGTGLDPSAVTPRTIMYSITTSATDTTGKMLATQLAVQFSTVRRMLHDVRIIDALTQSVQNDGTVVSPPSGGVGQSNFTDVFFRLFTSFTLPALPANATLVRAVLAGDQTAPTGTPYAKLGVVKAQHVNFAAFNANTFSATPIASVGDFSTNDTVETKAIDVTARVADDYANAPARGNRSQYRLEFPTGTTNDGQRHFAFFNRTSFSLRLTYDVP